MQEFVGVGRCTQLPEEGALYNVNKLSVDNDSNESYWRECFYLEAWEHDVRRLAREL